MNILSIETSCDETGVSLVSCTLKDDTYIFDVKADNLLSQAKLHAEYGGVFPSLAKREHAKAIIPLIKKTLKEAGIDIVDTPKKTSGAEGDNLEVAKKLLEREPSEEATLPQGDKESAETPRFKEGLISKLVSFFKGLFN